MTAAAITGHWDSRGPSDRCTVRNGHSAELSHRTTKILGVTQVKGGSHGLRTGGTDPKRAQTNRTFASFCGSVSAPSIRWAGQRSLGHHRGLARSQRDEEETKRDQSSRRGRRLGEEPLLQPDLMEFELSLTPPRCGGVALCRPRCSWAAARAEREYKWYLAFATCLLVAAFAQAGSLSMKQR